MKFYVNAFPVMGIIDIPNNDANAPELAAKLILKKFAQGKLPSPYTFVSEKGFYDDNGVERKDYIYVTDSLMSEK